MIIFMRCIIFKIWKCPENHPNITEPISLEILFNISVNIIKKINRHTNP